MILKRYERNMKLKFVYIHTLYGIALKIYCIDFIISNWKNIRVSKQSFVVRAKMGISQIKATQFRSNTIGSYTSDIHTSTQGKLCNNPLMKNFNLFHFHEFKGLFIFL